MDAETHTSQNKPGRAGEGVGPITVVSPQDSYLQPQRRQVVVGNGAGEIFTVTLAPWQPVEEKRRAVVQPAPMAGGQQVAWWECSQLWSSGSCSWP